MANSTLFNDPSIPSFHEYPMRRPFLNADITRNPSKPTKSYPESNAQAVLSALKGLQDKIKKLEHERAQAEKNLKSLATETDLYKDILATRTPEKETAKSPIPSEPRRAPSRKARFASPVISAPQNVSSKSAEEVEHQLRGADTRCNILERQLENMRKMVQNAEKERSEALERQIALEKDRGRITAQHRDAQEQLARLSEVEDHYRNLAQEKAVTETRVFDLEEKLKLEEHQKKLLADKAALLQTEAESNRILLQSQISAPYDETRPKTAKKKAPAKKKKPRPNSVTNKAKTPSQKPNPQVVRQGTQPHYRLNLADVPFVTGTNAGASHAVAANLQKVLFDLKQHNPVYCNDVVVSEVRMDESEHQVLVKQIGETTDPSFRKDLDMELESLVQKMEQKGDQISTVRRHRALLEASRKRPSSEKEEPRARPLLPLHQQQPPARSRSASGYRKQQPSCAMRRGCSVKSYSASSSPAAPGRLPGAEAHRNRLAFLRDMKTVHAALRKNDVSWD